MAEDSQDDAYELGEVDGQDGEIPSEWQNGAVYTLEDPVKCPHCREALRALRVVRMLRTQATFTSPLPRAGRVLICPACQKILSAELSGIL